MAQQSLAIRQRSFRRPYSPRILNSWPAQHEPAKPRRPRPRRPPPRRQPTSADSLTALGDAKKHAAGSRPLAPPPLPRRHVFAGLSHALGTARGDHPLRPVYGRAGEHRHQRPVPQVSLGRGLCPGPTRRIGKRHPKHRLLSQQGQEHPELLPAAGRAVRRPGAAGHRPTGRIAGHRPEDGQRHPRHRVRHRLGRRGGYARHATQPPPGAFAAERRREDREGPHGSSFPARNGSHSATA